MYYFLKLCFFIWLQLPGKLMGARIIYRWIFAPIYELFGKQINHAVNRTAEEMYDYNKEVAKSLEDMKGDAIDKASEEYLRRA